MLVPIEIVLPVVRDDEHSTVELILAPRQRHVDGFEITFDSLACGARTRPLLVMPRKLR